MLKASDFGLNKTGMLATIKLSVDFNNKVDKIITRVNEGIETGEYKNGVAVRKSLAQLKEFRRKGNNIEHALRTGKMPDRTYTSERMRYYRAILGAVVSLFAAIGLTTVSFNVLGAMALPAGATGAVITSVWSIFIILALFTTLYHAFSKYTDAKNDLIVAKYQDVNNYKATLDKAITKVNLIMKDLHAKASSEAQAIESIEKGIKVLGNKMEALVPVKA